MQSSIKLNSFDKGNDVLKPRPVNTLHTHSAIHSPAGRLHTRDRTRIRRRRRSTKHLIPLTPDQTLRQPPRTRLQRRRLSPLRTTNPRPPSRENIPPQPRRVSTRPHRRMSLSDQPLSLLLRSPSRRVHVHDVEVQLAGCPWDGLGFVDADVVEVAGAGLGVCCCLGEGVGQEFGGGYLG